MIIKASASLRNQYTEISKLCHDTGEPIYITKNGEGDLVVMSIEAYRKLRYDIMMLEGIIEAEEEIKKGKDNFIPAKQALKMIFGDDYNPDEYQKTIPPDELKVAEEDEKYGV